MKCKNDATDPIYTPSYSSPRQTITLGPAR